MFYYKRLRVRNLYSIGELDIDLSIPGIYLVGGENHFDSGADNNGSGKSAFFEAIGIVSTGKPFRKQKIDRIENFRRKGGLLIQLDVTPLPNHNYTLLRSRNDKEHKTGFKIMEGEEDISKRVERHEDSRIKTLFNMQPEILNNTLFITRENIDIFSAMTPKQRYESLEQIITDFMTPFDKMRIKATGKLSDIEEKIDSYEKDNISLDTILNEKRQQLSNIKEQIEGVDLKGVMESLENDKSKSIEKKEELASNFKFYVENKEKLTQNKEKLEEEIELLEIQIEQRDKLYDEISRAIDQFDYQINNQKNEKKKYEELKGGESTCPYCNSKVTDEHIEKELKRINDLITSFEKDKGKEVKTVDKIKQEKEKKDKKIKGVENKVQKLEDEIEDIKNKIHTTNLEMKEIDWAINDLTNRIKGYANIDDEINELESTIKQKENEVKRNNIRIKRMNEKVEIHTRWKNRLSYKGDFKPFVLEDLALMQASFSQDYLSRLWPGMNLEMPIDEGKVRIKLNNDIYLYDGMSSGEKRRINFALTLGRNKLYRMLGAHSPNILIFDEALDTLDTKGIEGVVSLLEYLVEERNLSIWVTTHNPKLALNATRYTMIKDKNGISSLSGPVRM